MRVVIATITRSNTWGGEVINMSLDSDMTINPFDMEPGQTEPSRDHLSFLRSLIRHMLGDKAVTDAEILDSVITKCIVSAYERAKMRTELRKKVPLLSDVQDELDHYIDPNNNEIVSRDSAGCRHKARQLGWEWHVRQSI